MKILAEIARFLEKLLEMGFAVQDSIHGGVAAHLQIIGRLAPLIRRISFETIDDLY
jgi:hypothetical protein